MEKGKKMNRTFYCYKEKTLVDISDCTFCKLFNKNKTKFCRFNEGSCDYYIEESIVKLIVTTDQQKKITRI